MHPLQALNEAELSSLIRVADRLLNTRQQLASGHRSGKFRAGSGIEFLDHREFSAGDDLRTIDWRVTARTRNAQIRRYIEEQAGDWYIALDCSTSMNIGAGKKWQLAVQCAAAIAYLLLHQGNRVSVLLFTEHIQKRVTLGQGNAHYARILQALHDITLPQTGGGSSLLCCVPRVKRNSPVFVISDLLAETGMLDGLSSLARQGGSIHLMQILDSRDYFLPGLSRVQLKDIESRDVLHTSLSQQQRQKFHEALNCYCERVVDVCRKQQVQYSFHLATEAWKSAVINHLQAGYQRP